MDRNAKIHCTTEHNALVTWIANLAGHASAAARKRAVIGHGMVSSETRKNRLPFVERDDAKTREGSGKGRPLDEPAPLGSNSDTFSTNRPSFVTRNLRMCQIVSLTFGVFCVLSLAGVTSGETWTDQSGKYQVEAEFVGVEGRSVVLRKIDGSTVKVPIDRLSAETRAQAKRLYEMSKSRASVDGDAPPTRGTDSGTSTQIQIVQAHTRKLIEAPYKGDLEPVLLLTHARIIEMAGGIDVMRKMMSHIKSDLNDKPDEPSQELESIEFPEDPTFVRVKEDEFVVVPFRTVVKSSRDLPETRGEPTSSRKRLSLRLENYDYLFGHKDENGDWKYLSGGGSRPSAFFPEFPADFVFPKQAMKVLSAPSP